MPYHLVVWMFWDTLDPHFLYPNFALGALTLTEAQDGGNIVELFWIVETQRTMSVTTMEETIAAQPENYPD